MPKRSRTKVQKSSVKSRTLKPNADPNVAAFDLVQLIARAEEEGKDPLAVALGRRGGLKGGKARAEKLSAEELRESARKAARARWSKKGP